MRAAIEFLQLTLLIMITIILGGIIGAGVGLLLAHWS